MKKKDVERLEKLESKDTKYCIGCKKIKPLFEFGFSAKDRKFAQIYCLECRREREKEGRKEKRILQDYGISLKTYDKMLEKQGGGCMICNTKTPEGKGRFHIDHNHLTGKIRGILCCHCNRMLGAAKDDIEILAKAITYLSRSKQ